MGRSRGSTGILTVAVLVLSVAAGFAQESGPVLTTSTKLVIMPGSVAASGRLQMPICPGAHFLVRELVATPEVVTGRTARDLSNLGYWAVSVPVYQLTATGANALALAVHGRGPSVGQADIAGGQPAISSEATVTAVLLGGSFARSRFEFNVHVSGTCGEPFVRP